MKDLIFFIFVILCLTTSALIAEIKTPFFPTHTGTELLYQIDEQKKDRYYLQQIIGQIENVDSTAIIHYTVSLLDKKKTLLIPTFQHTTSMIRDTVTIYPGNFIQIWKDEKIQFCGPGFQIPPLLSVGQRLKDGNLIIQESRLQTRIYRKERIVTAKTRLKTPAGSFKCYKIESLQVNTTLGMTTLYKTSTWYTPGIGIVKSETYQENGKLASRQLLLSIKNNQSNSVLQ